MAFLGWGVLVLVALAMSFYVLVISWNNLGRYNIGGVPNKTSTKFLTIMTVLVGAGIWYWVISIAPFSIVAK